ncbi:patatin-like phospholipase family protein [Neiella marina]|uniref:Patatin-like phospholipase family protein n=1 Tax=Neiella holothuriorum TaxID=2870530 RepID=A0ABS7EEX1_9GAMM|nr:patatin-like phospholipase family protein [Neiella holothuriorum]MBW8190876.1 patatin-like phospholipase family protein [Neiella holothuriorum]
MRFRKTTSPQQPLAQSALVLTGGGARAAYQVGVVKAISEWFPRNKGIPFDIISGTSAGAINGTALACYAANFRLGVKKIEWVWRHFETNKVYQSNLLRICQQLAINLLPSRLTNASQLPLAILDNSPLQQLLASLLDLSRIERNIDRGFIKAMSVSASSYATGNSVCFFQAEPEISDWYRVRRRGIRTKIGFEHLMASSALPMVFPASRIGKRFYGDGSIHQLAPLSPAIHLGARRILVIGTSDLPAAPPERMLAPPSAADIAGHLLDTIFSDSLRADLERLQRINNTLALLSKGEQQKIDLYPIQTHVINPTEDLKHLASPHYHRLPRSVRGLLKLMGVNPAANTALLSYLLFEKEYCQELIDLGYRDCMQQKEAILQFLLAS